MADLRAQLGRALEAVPATHVFSAGDERRLRAAEEEARQLRATAGNTALLREQVHGLEHRLAAAAERDQLCAQLECDNQRLCEQLQQSAALHGVIAALGCAFAPADGASRSCRFPSEAAFAREWASLQKSVTGLPPRSRAALSSLLQCCLTRRTRRSPSLRSELAPRIASLNDGRRATQA